MVKYLIGYFVCLLLVSIINHVSVKPALASAKNSEKALALCLSGKPIQVGDAYFTCNEMRIPK